MWPHDIYVFSFPAKINSNGPYFNTRTPLLLIMLQVKYIPRPFKLPQNYSNLLLSHEPLDSLKSPFIIVSIVALLLKGV